MTGGRVFVCARCSATTGADLGNGRLCGLPRAWEHQDSRACPDCVWTTSRPDPALAAPVCPSCIGKLLDAVLEGFRRQSPLSSDLARDRS